MELPQPDVIYRAERQDVCALTIFELVVEGGLAEVHLERFELAVACLVQVAGEALDAIDHQVLHHHRVLLGGAGHRAEQDGDRDLHLLLHFSPKPSDY